MQKLEEQFGPVYDLTSAKLQSFRRRSRKGLATWDRDQRHAYADAVEQAVLAKQRSFLNTAREAERRPNCASGTWHTCGEAISAAVRNQHKASLAACPAQQRRNRTPRKWADMYEAAMKEKRERLASMATPSALVVFAALPKKRKARK